MEAGLAAFEEHEIWPAYDEALEAWYFSLIDIVRVLEQKINYQAERKYSNILKQPIKKGGS